jgi:hypothetical protein
MPVRAKLRLTVSFERAFAVEADHGRQKVLRIKRDGFPILLSTPDRKMPFPHDE